MTKNKNLNELGNEYEAAASIVKTRLDEKKEELKSLKNRTCSLEAYNLKREIKSLYIEYRQAVEIAGYLKGYYEPHIGKREIFAY